MALVYVTDVVVTYVFIYLVTDVIVTFDDIFLADVIANVGTLQLLQGHLPMADVIAIDTCWADVIALYCFEADVVAFFCWLMLLPGG